MLALQMLTREKSRSLLRQKQGKEEMSVNHKFQELVRTSVNHKFVRKLFEGPHVKSVGLPGSKISFSHWRIERLLLVRLKNFIKDPFNSY